MQAMAHTKNVKDVDAQKLRERERRSKNIVIRGIVEEKSETPPSLAIAIEGFLNTHFAMSRVTIYGSCCCQSRLRAPMEAADALIPAEHREWVKRLRHGGPTPLSPDCLNASPNTWASPPCHVFSVRGADYTRTKAKIPASDCLLHPLTFEFLQGPSQISHIMDHPHSRVRAALDAACCSEAHSQPFVWAFNFQVGNKTHHSNVFYFVSFYSPPKGSLMQKFLDGDDAFRNDRLKLLLRLPKAPGLVQVTVGARWPVCMLGKIMKCTYIREKRYIEVDVDAASSMLVRTAIRLTFGLTPLVVADLAFVLEGIHPEELPERILGAMRLVHADPSSAIRMEPNQCEVSEEMNMHKVSMVPKARSSSNKDPVLGLS
ncbi:hypothetical protein L7F22_031848 [Adiantum nelumboides]|nr:hypothetical protein [Adiantum nelumboides]